jgi:protein involved in polysaccharide export with SLBB domain
MFLGIFVFQMLFAQTVGIMTPQVSAQSQNMVTHMSYDANVYSAVEIDPEDYIVGSGDKFLIQISHLSTSTYSVDVSPMGDLMIPSVGQLHISGMVFKDAVEQIRKKCKQRFSTAEIDVNLVDVRDVNIPVFGAVQNPEMLLMYTDSDVNHVIEPSVRTPKTAGTIQQREVNAQITNEDYVLPASLRLSDLLSVLSLHYLAKVSEIEVRGYGDTSIVNIYDYYLNGNFDDNPYLYEIKSIYIPYADIETECVQVYGPINTKAFVPLVPGESVGEFLKRKIQITAVSNYDAVTVKRDGKIILDHYEGGSENDIKLLPGDVIEVSSAKRIMVNGFVNKPGIYNYIQGHTVADFIAMAGGVNSRGSNKSSMIIRGNKKIRNAENVMVERGDIIVVKRSLDHIFVGDYSVLQFLATLASMTLSFIAAYNSIQ